MPTKRPRPRPADDDGGDDEAPAAAAPNPRTTTQNGDERDRTLLPRGGWTEAQRQMDSTSNWAQVFKPDENTQFIKFLDDLPYMNFKRHWIERASANPGVRNVRAYTCLKTFDGKECPLCKIGEKPQAVAAFNIAIVGDDGQVLLRSWETQPRIYNVLKAYSNDTKIAPLTKGFFMVSKSGASGRGGTVQYNISPIRGSSMEEDYDVPIPDQSVFDTMERYGPDILEVPTVKVLRDLANELADEDYDD